VNIRFSLLLILVITGVSWGAIANAAEFPGAQWTTVAPQNAGLDAAKLMAARDYALTGGGSGCVIRGGKLVISWGDSKRRYDLKSSTKSFGAAALGLAVADQKVTLDDRAVKHHPTLGIPPEENSSKGWLDDITLRHLAAQTAGFDKPGGYVPLMFQPGAQWSYSDSGPNWLAECLTLIYRRDLDELMFERIFAPLGIERTDLSWRKNAYRSPLIEGIPRREFGAGISANVDAMARFGLLWLRGGEWDGRQILPKAYVDQARLTQFSGLPVRKPEDYGNASRHYGLLWWNNADEAIEGVPLDTYWSWGLYDSLIVVMPALDIVVARAGQSWKREEGADHYGVLQAFLQPIASAVLPSRQTKYDGSDNALAAPYPPSPVVAEIEWAPSDSVIRLAKGSDNWPITWGDDDALYTAYGDGRGFEPFSERKLSLGFAKVIGIPPEIRAVNLPSPTGEACGDGKAGRKASGLLCIRGTLYLLTRNSGNSQLAWSSDHGISWRWADWRFTQSFGCPTFLNFGRDYAGARDDFVYIYSADQDTAYERADRYLLARVPKRELLNRAAYEFFLDVDHEGEPRWTRELSEAGAVFSNPGACYRSGISYNPAIKRYLWCQTGPGMDTRYAGGFAIYDAPEPWGPWSIAFHTSAWDIGPGESSFIPTKWISPDGLSFHLLFSGDDSFSVRRGQIRLVQR